MVVLEEVKRRKRETGIMVFTVGYLVEQGLF
jgi:hypothetical protein